MLPVRCNKLLNKTFACLPRKTIGSGICFFDVIFKKYDTAALRHINLPQLRQSHKKKAPVTVMLHHCVVFAGQTMN